MDLREKIARNTGFSRNEVQQLILNEIAEHYKSMELPKYSDFREQCGFRPRDICYNIGCLDTQSALLKELEVDNG